MINVGQVPQPAGKEGVAISTKTRGGDTITTFSLSTNDKPDNVLKDASFGHEGGEVAWASEITLTDEESDCPEQVDMQDATPKSTDSSSEDTSCTDTPSLSGIRSFVYHSQR